MVVRDFDAFLDAPGQVSHEAMDELLEFLGIEARGPAEEWWATRVDAAAEAGRDRLIAALAHENPAVRRVTTCVLCYCYEPGVADAVRAVVPADEGTRLGLHIVLGTHEGWSPEGDELARFGSAFGALLGSHRHPDMLGPLASCAGRPGEVLAELPWAEPDWDTPVRAVDELLDRAPELHVPWLLALAGDHAPELADFALRRGDPVLVEPYGLGLLEHPDVEVRRAAVRRLGRWKFDGHLDAVAALLPDPDLGDAALDTLTRADDRRALPRLRALLDDPADPRLRVVAGLGAELVPDVVARLDGPRAPELVEVAANWGALLDRPEVAAWLGRLSEEAAVIRFCRRVALRRRIGDELRDQVRVLATGPSLRVRQHAQFALLETGETEWLVAVLIAEIVEHPVRTGRPGPHNGNYGSRADTTACAWLGRLGPVAVEAVTVLRSVVAEAGEASAAAAEALQRITG
ncbi:HEAT repeat domain-containing protein [Amycolatopsis sp. 195334CR]|uniref:HEAT repeat domain-containing protein n=1 Tax=Amycolatopsis sp. 195334CR TaxID=2814588 RepID=UPI001A8ECB0B|nr:HEAT repeat domain-containing protein [Amycolatopsis sp. 195334CR]MBN6042050.1 HEAT repeat domain-containing protein [Amycolatopsis sp. 195334CR]